MEPWRDPLLKRALTISLPTLPPVEYSANKSRGRSWKAQYGASYGKRGARDQIMALVLEQGWKGQPLTTARVLVHFYLPDLRTRDHGMLVERCKPWLDALTVGFKTKEGWIAGAGVILDDKLKCIGFPVYTYEYRSRQAGTIITVEAIE